MSGPAGALRAVLAVAAVIGYQVGAHYSVSTPGAHGLGLAMALVPPLLMVLGMALHSTRRAVWLPLWLLVIACLWFARAPLLEHFAWGLYLEHLSFNLAMALLFGRTLGAGRMPLCTQFAAMLHGEPSLAVARYTRRLTLAWTLFFLATAVISTLLFAKASIVDWSTFANYLSLPLVGVMFAVEAVVRRLALPDEPHSGVLASLRAYRQSSRRGETHTS